MRGTCCWIVAESSILFYRHFCGILGENHVIFFHTFWRENHVIFFTHFGAKSRDFLHARRIHSRRSTRVIWFREGSPEEGDRIVAGYKLECELGLNSGSTENYSCRSPCVERPHRV